MSLPKEGSRDVDDGIIVSMVPDICLTPQGFIDLPVPYTIWCRQADAANLANSVRQTDDRSHAVASIVLQCYGDEPGTGGGIDSGTNGAECTPKTWSQTVRAEGRNMVRHLDQWWMNHRNTYGMLIYIKDQGQYEVPQPEQILAQMSIQQPTNTGIQNFVGQASQLQQATLAPPIETPMGPLPGPAQAQQLQNVGSALHQGYEEQFGPGTMPMSQRPEKNIENYKKALEAFIAKSLVRTSQKKCPQQNFCFPGPKDLSKLPEYEQQLEMQNKTLNNLNPCHYLLNRARYQFYKTMQMQNFSSAARRQAQADYTNGGGTDRVAALHCLDMVAGGDPHAICDMGSTQVNSLIGRHWQDVVSSMDKYARYLCTQGCPNMRAILEVCGAPTS